MAKHTVGLLSNWGGPAPIPFLLSAVMIKFTLPNTSLGMRSGPGSESRGSSLFNRKLTWQEGQGWRGYPKTQAREPTPGTSGFLTGFPRDRSCSFQRSFFLTLHPWDTYHFLVPTTTELLLLLYFWLAWNTSCLMLLLASPVQQVILFLTKEVGAKTV